MWTVANTPMYAGWARGHANFMLLKAPGNAGAPVLLSAG